MDNISVYTGYTQAGVYTWKEPPGYKPFEPYGYENWANTFTSSIEGDLNMADKRLEGYYGRDYEIYFSRPFTYLPFTVLDTRNGAELGKVHEIGKGDGLGSTESRWSILDSNGEVTFPWYTWNDLLSHVQSLR